MGNLEASSGSKSECSQPLAGGIGPDWWDCCIRQLTRVPGGVSRGKNDDDLLALHNASQPARQLQGWRSDELAVCSASRLLNVACCSVLSRALRSRCTHEDAAGAHCFSGQSLVGGQATRVFGAVDGVVLGVQGARGARRSKSGLPVIDILGPPIAIKRLNTATATASCSVKCTSPNATFALPFTAQPLPFGP